MTSDTAKMEEVQQPISPWSLSGVQYHPSPYLSGMPTRARGHSIIVVLPFLSGGFQLVLAGGGEIEPKTSEVWGSSKFDALTAPI